MDYHQYNGWKGLKKAPATPRGSYSTQITDVGGSLESIFFSKKNQSEDKNDVLSELTSGDSSNPVTQVQHEITQIQGENLIIYFSVNQSDYWNIN